MSHRHALVAIVIIAAFGTSACSWAFVRQPADTDPEEVTPPVDCTTSEAAPILDTIGAIPPALLTVGYTAILTQTVAQGGDRAGQRLGEFLLFGGLTAAPIASAVYGFKQTDRCQQFREGVVDEYVDEHAGAP